MHLSVPIENSIEFINVENVSPLISHVQIKVCYVDDKPNRNGTVITKEVATELGKNILGSPIVGFYDTDTKDFDEHTRNYEISEDGDILEIDLTKPYGFVDTQAKVWFQKFLDDDSVEREYLVTEGYIWTEAYPESKRILENGNNQSMELNRKSIKGSWAKDINRNKKFFIINEALIEKLCILGQDIEPCFEGAQIKETFSLHEDFENLKITMFSMINKFKEELNKGGDQPMITEYAVELGDTLWRAIYNEISEKYNYAYYIKGIYEENGQKFAILESREDVTKIYRLDFQYDESGFFPAETISEVSMTFIPAGLREFTLEDNQSFEEEFKKKEDSEEEKEDSEEEVSEEESDEDEEKKKEKFSDNSDESIEDKNKEQIEEEYSSVDLEEKIEYNLEENSEYLELKNNFDSLSQEYSLLQGKLEELENELSSLRTFKLEKDREEKQAMINSFYMLSDEDKTDVVENIDNYSLDDIEAKLAVICVRNKVNFNLQEDKEESPQLTFALDIAEAQDFSVPDWVKQVKETQKKYNI